MSITIHMTDDLTRPADSSGKPIEQSDNELYVTISGYSFRWYSSCYITYNENSSNLSATLNYSNYLFGKMGDETVSKNLRIIMQFSYTNDFSTHSDVTTTMSGGKTTNAQIFYVFARKYPDSLGKSLTLNGLGKAPGNGNFHAYNCTQTLTFGNVNRQVWIRMKVQINNNGTWTDCVRPNASDRTWKTFTTYIPFYQSVTSPSTVYGNSLNQFACSIPAKFISEFSDVRYNSATFGTSNKVVRNATLPYITTGTATNYLYLAPCLSVTASPQYETYSFTMYLRIVDPSDSNYIITVSQRDVSGNLQYLQSDDYSIFNGISWKIIDPNNIYHDYSAFLSNIMSSVDIRILATNTYGLDLSSNRFSYYHNSSSPEPFSIEASETIVNIEIPQGSVSIVGIKCTSGHLSTYYTIDDKLIVPVIPYHVPSLPVATIHRCNEDGGANDLGAYCRIDWSVSITPINDLNSKKLVIRHPQGTTTYDPLDSYTQNGSFIVEANTEYSYNIVFEVSDDLRVITKTLRLSTAHVTMDWLYNGRGVAFGKVANQENAVEIAEDWKLICYDLLYNNTDMSKWLHQAESRIAALEQFIGNLGNTVGNVTQYQVSFYNQDGSEFYDRQWIRSGNTATDPIENHRISTPEKESTTTATFSFVGWSKYQNRTAADSTSPLLNITANRDIYAAFSSETREYSVRWFNDLTLLETDSGLTYHSNATFNATEPTKENCTFVAWSPSGKYITDNTDAKAQFYNETEITDSWEDIMKAVKEGTASQKYSVGQYKELDCGEFGKTIMRIKGFRMNEYASSKKKVTIAWEGADCLTTPRRMNPEIEFETEDVYNTDAWTYTKNTFEGFHRFYSKYAHLTHTNCSTTLTASVTCSTSGTFKIDYFITRTSEQSQTQPVPENNLLTIKVNGSTIFSGLLSDDTRNTRSYTASANSTYNIEVTFKATEGSISADNVYVYIYPPSISNDTITYTIPKYATSRILSYTEGTGCFGGWEKSELRAWLNGAFFNQIDPIVRNSIQLTKRHSLSIEFDDTSANSFKTVDKISYDKISIPAISEIVGRSSSEPYGNDYKYVHDGKRYPHGVTPSSSTYYYSWSRSAYTNYNYDIQYSEDGISTRIFGFPKGFNTISSMSRNSVVSNGGLLADNNNGYVCICFDT